ncbi:MAG: MMPL family transporter [Actinomycetota bacterium]
MAARYRTRRVGAARQSPHACGGSVTLPGLPPDAVRRAAHRLHTVRLRLPVRRRPQRADRFDRPHPWRAIGIWILLIAAIGRVIVAAAIIMSVAFFAFLTGADRTIMEFGLALGLAIALDAFVVRLTLVPALMHLLDGRAWWIPRWLDRLLPRLTIEPPEPRG